MLISAVFAASIAQAQEEGNPWVGPYVATVDFDASFELVESDAISIAAGDNHTCVIGGCGTISCWGDDGAGQISDVPRKGGFVQLTASGDYTCALVGDLDGTNGHVPGEHRAHCWGGPGHAPPSDRTYRRLMAGADFGCGITDGRNGQSAGQVECWGNAPANLPSGGGNTRPGAGDAHGCVARSQGSEIECFGDDAYGQSSPPAQPWEIGTGTTAQLIRGGARHTCVIASGYLGCFGDDYDLQSSGHDAHPTQPGPWATEIVEGLWQFPGAAWRDVDAGEHHTCAIDESGSGRPVYCWGSDPYGEASPPSGDFLAIATGLHHSCGIDADNAVQCWGDDSAGQTDVPYLSPVCALYQWPAIWHFLVDEEAGGE